VSVNDQLHFSAIYLCDRNIAHSLLLQVQPAQHQADVEANTGQPSCTSSWVCLSMERLTVSFVE
jgi:hypothetical protein